MTVQDGAKQAQGYVFNPTWDLETERLITNEAIWDPGTIERFERLGVDRGWACLEVGAGAGGAAEWLTERVGSTGRVVAADLEVGRLDRLAGRGVEILRNDLRTEELPAESFDLVHARMLIQHLQDREAAVARLIRALRPGGWLFVEDTDSLPLFRSYKSERFLTDIKESGYGLMRQAGHEPRGGHFDLEIALNSELTEVSAEGRVVMVHGGSEQARHYQLWLEFMRSKIVAAGLLTDARIDEAIAEMGDPANRWLSQVLISTFGRKEGAE
jgi:SAM-dependent methyltransferase